MNGTISFSDLPTDIKDKLISLNSRRTEAKETDSAPQSSFVYEIRTQSITPESSCPVCGDGGWVQLLWSTGRGQLTRPSTSPIKNGQKILHSDGLFYFANEVSSDCELCHNNVRRINALWRTSGLLENEKKWRLDYYDQFPAGKELAVMAANSLLKQIPNPKGMYFLHGDYGRGKTGIMKATVAAMIRAGFSARYITAEDFISQVRSTYSDGNVTESDVFASHLGARLLCIDEVDPERMTGTSHGNAIVTALLSKRYDRRFQAATMLASNKRSNELWGYLASRLQDAERIEVAGLDLRGRYD